MEPKSPSESSIITYQLAMPAYSNPSWRDNSLDIGAINGGAILNLVDNVAGWVALRHCRAEQSPHRIDKMDFLNPVHVGELTIKSISKLYWQNFTFRGRCKY